MKPVSPVIPGEDVDEVIIAEGQSEYEYLPALIVYPGLVLTRWKLNLRDRIRAAFVGDVYVWSWTFGKPMHPVVLDTERPRQIKHIAKPVGRSKTSPVRWNSFTAKPTKV